MTEMITHPKLLFDASAIERIRRNIETYDWARRLFEKLKHAVDGGEECFTSGAGRFTLTRPPAELSAFPDEGMTRGAEGVQKSRLSEMAMVGVLSGDRRYAQRVRDLLVVVVAEVLPRGNDLTQLPQLFTWAFCQDALDLLVAYDLTCNEPVWNDGDREKVEDGFKAVMALVLEEPTARHLCNTGFYYQIYKVGCGCFFGRQDWIDEGLAGRAGFFDALKTPWVDEKEMRWYEFGDRHHRLQLFNNGTVDSMLWNETGVYGSVMLSQYCIIADLMRHYDGTDLWNYKDPNGGGSIRGMFDGMVIRAFMDGDVALFGENGMYDRRHPGYDTYITSGITLFNIPAKHIARTKFDLAYARYEDPGYGWLALQNPDRDDWDDKLGFAALWHGVDASEMTVSPPDVRSHTFQDFGTAMLRSTEGPDYWESETPTIAVTFGAAKYRNHPDRFGFILHALGTVLEPDLVASWDYGVPQGGRNVTPFTASSYAHNVLVVDGRNHGMDGGKLVIDDYGEHIKVLGMAGERIHPGDANECVDMGRCLGLTREYLLDVTYIAGMQLPHQFDLVIPAYGELSVPEIALEDYDLGADLGFLEIDTGSQHPENRWLTEGKRAEAPESWMVRFDNADGANLAIHSGGWDRGELLAGKAPICWAPYLEEIREEPEPLRGRYNILIHRKHRSQDKPDYSGEMPMALAPHSEDHCHFFTVHEPFRDKPRIQSVRRLPLAERKAELWDPFGIHFPEAKLSYTTPRVMEINADGFTDYFIYIDHFIALRGGDPGRAILETRAFRIEFSGPYAYLRIVDGEIVAQQGTIKAAAAK